MRFWLLYIGFVLSCITAAPTTLFPKSTALPGVSELNTAFTTEASLLSDEDDDHTEASVMDDEEGTSTWAMHETTPMTTEASLLSDEDNESTDHTETTDLNEEGSSTLTMQETTPMTTEASLLSDEEGTTTLSMQETTPMTTEASLLSDEDNESTDHTETTDINEEGTSTLAIQETTPMTTEASLLSDEEGTTTLTMQETTPMTTEASLLSDEETASTTKVPQLHEEGQTGSTMQGTTPVTTESALLHDGMTTMTTSTGETSGHNSTTPKIKGELLRHNLAVTPTSHRLRGRVILANTRLEGNDEWGVNADQAEIACDRIARYQSETPAENTLLRHFLDRIRSIRKKNKPQPMEGHLLSVGSSYEVLALSRLLSPLPKGSFWTGGKLVRYRVNSMKSPAHTDHTVLTWTDGRVGRPGVLGMTKLDQEELREGYTYCLALNLHDASWQARDCDDLLPYACLITPRKIGFTNKGKPMSTETTTTESMTTEPMTTPTESTGTPMTEATPPHYTTHGMTTEYDHYPEEANGGGHEYPTEPAMGTEMPSETTDYATGMTEMTPTPGSTAGTTSGELLQGTMTTPTPGSTAGTTSGELLQGTMTTPTPGSTAGTTSGELLQGTMTTQYTTGMTEMEESSDVQEPINAAVDDDDDHDDHDDDDDDYTKKVHKTTDAWNTQTTKLNTEMTTEPSVSQHSSESSFTATPTMGMSTTGPTETMTTASYY